MLLVILALSLVEAPPAPVAATAAPTQAAGAPAAKDDPMEKVVCRTDEPELGSMIATKKRCMTRRQWNELSRDSQDSVRSYQRGSFSRPG